eukprot:UN03987
MIPKPQPILFDPMEARKWRSKQDVESGDYYFHNTVTKVVTWDLPEILLNLPQICPHSGCTCQQFEMDLACRKPVFCKNCGHEHF